MSEKCPVVLHDGETADYLMPLAEYESINANRPMYVGRFPKIAARFTRVIVRTSTGKSCSARIERGLRERFIKAGAYRRPQKNNLDEDNPLQAL